MGKLFNYYEKKTQVQGLNRGFFLRLRGCNNPSRRKGSSALNMKNKGCMSQILSILANQAYWVSLALLRTQDLYTQLTFRNYIVVDVLDKSHETHTHTIYIYKIAGNIDQLEGRTRVNGVN